MNNCTSATCMVSGLGFRVWGLGIGIYTICKRILSEINVGCIVARHITLSYVAGIQVALICCYIYIYTHTHLNHFLDSFKGECTRYYIEFSVLIVRPKSTELVTGFFSKGHQDLYGELEEARSQEVGLKGILGKVPWK